MSIIFENLLVSIPSYFNYLIIFILNYPSFIFFINFTKTFKNYFFFFLSKKRWEDYLFFLFKILRNIWNLLSWFIITTYWIIINLFIIDFFWIFILSAINVDFVYCFKILKNWIFKKFIISSLSNDSTFVHNDNSICHIDKINSVGY